MRCRKAVAATIALCPLFGDANAQMGPLDANGYLEYRYSLGSGDSINTFSSHGLQARTDFTTFFWRPWILNTSGSLSLRQRRADGQIGDEKSGDIFGSLRLNFLPRSSFPLTLFYENLDGTVDSDTNSRTGRTQRYGLQQQLLSRKYGDYSLEWRKSSYDILYQDGFSLPRRSDNEMWQLLGQKGIGRNMISLNSRSLLVNSEIPMRKTESMRHTLRHTFRAGSSFDIRNTLFYSDETLDFGMEPTDRTYRQVSSVTTWRPGTERRLLVTGRGFLQESDSRNSVTSAGATMMSLSGSANYQYSDHLSFTGGLAFMVSDNDTSRSQESTIQSIGADYRSIRIPLGRGLYNYFGKVSVRNRTNPYEGDASSVQDFGTTLSHSYAQNFGSRGNAKWDFRVVQQVYTLHDTLGREQNSLQHSVSITHNVRNGDVNRFLRFSVLDLHTFADERRVNQLANLQYSMQGQVSRDRSWNIAANIQYGSRNQEKPAAQASDSSSMSYSVTASYRETNLFDVNYLTLTSDLRWLSEDFRTEDPFDPDYMLETERLNSSWRNRLEYRIGLLQLRADASLTEINGNWSAVLYLSMRRYFGMT